MRAEGNTYHIDCFRCTACSRQFIAGDFIALRQKQLYCREDNDILERNLLASQIDEENLACSGGNNPHKLQSLNKRNSIVHGKVPVYLTHTQCQTLLFFQARRVYIL